MTESLIYFESGELIAESGDVKVYKFRDLLHLEIGPGHNLWAVEDEIEEYKEQIEDKPYGDCLEIGLGLGVASKYILSSGKVKSLTTVEKNFDVVQVQKVVNPIEDKRHNVIIGSGLDYMISAEQIDKKFDFIFLDFYSVIDEDTLPEIMDYIKVARKLKKSSDSIVMPWLDIYTPYEFIQELNKFLENDVYINNNNTIDIEL